MSCEVYSNGANLTVEHSMATLPTNFCPANWQAVFNQIALSLISTMQGNFGAFTIGSNVPDTGDRDKLWFKLDADTCEPLGFFIYFGGAWVRAIPHPLLPGTIIDYYDANLAALGNNDAAAKAYIEALDGGDDGGGPFWYMCDGANSTPDLRGKVRVGAGQGSQGDKDGEGRTREDYDQEESGGEEVHALSSGELPASMFNLQPTMTGIYTCVNDATGDLSEVGGGNGTNWKKVANPFATPGNQSHNNMQPYCAIYAIMRSSRMV